MEIKILKLPIFYFAIIFLSFLQFQYNLLINDNYKNNIFNQADIDGSDQYIIYQWANKYREKGFGFAILPPKYMLSTVLINCIEGVESSSNLIIPLLKWAYYVGCVLFLLRCLRKYSKPHELKLFGAYLLLHPMVSSWHPWLLRDDLILASVLGMVGFGIRVVDNLDNHRSAVFVVMGVLFFGIMLFMTRPELAGVLLAFILLVIFFYLRLSKRILYALLVAIVVIYWLPDILNTYRYGLRAVGTSIDNIFTAIRTFHFSPLPWNILSIANAEHGSDVSQVWLWFYLAVPFSIVTLLAWLILVATKTLKLEHKGLKTVFFFALPVVIDLSYGITSGTTEALGPRQGAVPSALLFYYFVVPAVFAIKRRPGKTKAADYDMASGRG